MKTRIPTQQEIEELVSFLPQLYAEGFTPIKRWCGGTKDQNGVFILPWPEYAEVVKEFFRAASGNCWTDYNYHPVEAGRMLKDDDIIRTADLAKIQTMLTYCVRGERFCVGHWDAVIEGGYIRRLLQRLTEIGSINLNPNAL